jgi:hypothetical protein
LNDFGEVRLGFDGFSVGSTKKPDV